MSKFPLRLIAINLAKSPRKWSIAKFKYSKDKNNKDKNNKDKIYILTSMNGAGSEQDKFTGQICMNHDRKWYMIIDHIDYNLPFELSYQHHIEGQKNPIGYYQKDIRVEADE